MQGGALWGCCVRFCAHKCLHIDVRHQLHHLAALEMPNPLSSGVSQSERESSLRAAEGKWEGRKGEGSRGRRLNRFEMTGSRPGWPDAEGSGVRSFRLTP